MVLDTEYRINDVTRFEQKLQQMREVYRDLDGDNYDDMSIQDMLNVLPIVNRVLTHKT